MTVRRIMGTEVEYGISVPGQPARQPDGHLVPGRQRLRRAPELHRGGRARWDYEEESPLRDARGFTYSGALYDPPRRSPTRTSGWPT
jgi:proteasome accessory factor A